MAKKANDDSSLSHTRWNCKYHIVFIPKYRRKAIYGKLRADIGQILRQLCEYKGVEIIETHAMSDHIHMLATISPKLARNQEQEDMMQDKMTSKEYQDPFKGKAIV